jgi:hypothetical protein
MAKKWIAGAIQHPGALTRKAKAAGVSVASFMAHPPKGITTTTQRQISLARTLKSFHKGGRSK